MTTRRTDNRGKAGFSLIELLAAMAILMVIVVMMTTIFSNSDRVWNLGTGRANNCSDGRAAMNLMAHDLEYAVADDILTFAMANDRNSLKTYGFTNSEICFVSLEHDIAPDTATNPGESKRTAREVHYYVLEVTNHIYGLWRGYYSKEIYDSHTAHCYFNRTWHKTGGASAETGAPNPGRPSGGDFLAYNVVGMKVYAPGPPSGAPSSVYYSDPKEYSRVQDKAFVTNRLPAYVDIFLEVLDESAMDRAADLAVSFGETGDETREFIEKNVRRYTTRVYFDNRHGYKIRGNVRM